MGTRASGQIFGMRTIVGTPMIATQTLVSLPITPRLYGYDCTSWSRMSYETRLAAVLRNTPAPPQGIGNALVAAQQRADANSLLAQADAYCASAGLPVLWSWPLFSVRAAGQTEAPTTPEIVAPTIDQQIATAVAPHVAAEAQLNREARGWKIAAVVVVVGGVVGWLIKPKSKRK